MEKTLKIRPPWAAQLCLLLLLSSVPAAAGARGFDVKMSKPRAFRPEVDDEVLTMSSSLVINLSVGWDAVKLSDVFLGPVDSTGHRMSAPGLPNAHEYNGRVHITRGMTAEDMLVGPPPFLRYWEEVLDCLVTTGESCIKWEGSKSLRRKISVTFWETQDLISAPKSPQMTVHMFECWPARYDSNARDTERDGVPTEELTLNFQRLEFEYHNASSSRTSEGAGTPPPKCTVDVLNRREHDHMGNFNFVVEVEGVEARASQVSGGSEHVETSYAPQGCYGLEALVPMGGSFQMPRGTGCGPLMAAQASPAPAGSNFEEIKVTYTENAPAPTGASAAPAADGATHGLRPPRHFEPPVVYHNMRRALTQNSWTTFDLKPSVATSAPTHGWPPPPNLYEPPMAYRTADGGTHGWPPPPNFYEPVISYRTPDGGTHGWPPPSNVYEPVIIYRTAQGATHGWPPPPNLYEPVTSYRTVDGGTHGWPPPPHVYEPVISYRTADGGTHGWPPPPHLYEPSVAYRAGDGEASNVYLAAPRAADGGTHGWPPPPHVYEPVISYRTADGGTHGWPPPPNFYEPVVSYRTTDGGTHGWPPPSNVFEPVIVYRTAQGATHGWPPPPNLYVPTLNYLGAGSVGANPTPHPSKLVASSPPITRQTYRRNGPVTLRGTFLDPDDDGDGLASTSSSSSSQPNPLLLWAAGLMRCGAGKHCRDPAAGAAAAVALGPLLEALNFVVTAQDARLAFTLDSFFDVWTEVSVRSSGSTLDSFFDVWLARYQRQGKGVAAGSAGACVGAAPTPHPAKLEPANTQSVASSSTTTASTSRKATSLGCPMATPFPCWDGTCASSEEACAPPQTAHDFKRWRVHQWSLVTRKVPDDDWFPDSDSDGWWFPGVDWYPGMDEFPGVDWMPFRNIRITDRLRVADLDGDGLDDDCDGAAYRYRHAFPTSMQLPSVSNETMASGRPLHWTLEVRVNRIDMA